MFQWVFTDLIIRKFQESDAEEVSEVGTKSWFYTYTHIFGEQYVKNRTSRSYNIENIKRTTLFSQHTVMFEAEINSKIIGFSQPCYWNYLDSKSFDPKKILLSKIYLLPEYIRKGIGTKLLTKAEEWNRENGFKEYFLYVHSENLIGMNFYLKVGFTIIEEANEEGEFLLGKRFE